MWRQCPPTEAIELLFRRHRHSESEPGTPALLAYAHGGRDNWDEANPNTVTSEESEDQLESDSVDDSNGGQPESSATAAKWGAPQVPQTHRMLRPYGMAQTSRPAKAKTGIRRQMRNQVGLDGANDTESDVAEIYFCNRSVGLVPDSEVISDIPLGKKRSTSLPEACVLTSGRQKPGLVRDEADRTKAPTSTPIDSSSKHDQAGMTGGADPERPADICQPLRHRVRTNETPHTGPNTGSDTGSQPAEVQKPLGNASFLVSPSLQA